MSARALRAPPAYQTYASDDLASERYFGLSFAERGLLDAMRRACWVSRDGTVPATAAALAVFVRASEADVRHALTSRVLDWFVPSPDGTRLVEPDLQRQRDACHSKRQAQANGAAATNAKRWGKP